MVYQNRPLDDLFDNGGGMDLSLLDVSNNVV